MLIENVLCYRKNRGEGRGLTVKTQRREERTGSSLGRSPTTCFFLFGPRRLGRGHVDEAQKIIPPRSDFGACPAALVILLRKKPG